MSEQKIRVAISIGDVNGIGPEVIIKSLNDSRMSELCTPIVYGSAQAIDRYRSTIPGAENFVVSPIATPSQAREKRVNLIECAGEIPIQSGTQTPEAGKAAVAALRRAADDLKSGAVDVLVTAPINKENVQSEEFNYTGHTEFLAAELGGEPIMMMVGEELKVGLATIHLPIAEVSGQITKERILSRLAQLRQSLIEDFRCIEPRIAVMALNPHAGDGGMLGGEEQEIIRPAIAEAVGECKMLVFGPFAADGLFASGGWRKYDAVLAMYHDQGLAPFKALSPDGVNYTASLGRVRTSPDHGVAYDIAGQGVADPASMRNAIYAAIDIFRARERYKEMTANPLKHYEREHGKDVSVKDLPQEE